MVQSIMSIFLIVTIVGDIVTILISVSIQALILKYFVKKKNLSDNYGNAWISLFIPLLIVSLVIFIITYFNLPDFLIIVFWLLYFVLLIFSIKIFYKTNFKISSILSLKLFLVVLVVFIIVAGGQTLLSLANNPINSNVPQSVCSSDCEFALRTDIHPVNSFTAIGYNIPVGEYNNKNNYIIAKKTYIGTEFNNLKRGVNNKILGKLDANNCNYMDFVNDKNGTEGGTCSSSSKSFIINLKNLII